MKEFNYKLPRKANQKKRAMISISVCALLILITVSYAIFIVINKDRFINTQVAPFTVSAPETCFDFDEGSGEIVGYYSNEGNVATAPACPMNVKVPSTINGHTVTKLGGYLFNGLGFTAIEIPNTITSIGAYALANNNIRDLVIPNSVTSIGDYSFYNSKIENLTLSSGLTIIPNYSFSNNNIINLEIPSNIKSIETKAFNENKISNLILNEGLESINIEAFFHNNILSITLPTTMKSIGYGAFNDNQLPDNQAFIYKINTDGTIDNKVIVSYGGSRKDNIVLPTQVQEIGMAAFHMTGINSITLNQGLKTIKKDSFTKNNLTAISIPSSVTSIEFLSFNNNKLKTSDAIIYGRNSNGTQNTSIVSYGGTGGSIIVPEGTTAIEQQAFYNSGITSITLPTTLTRIAAGAFNNNQLPDDQAFIYNRNSDGSIDYSKIVSYGGSSKNNIVIPKTVNGVNLTNIGPSSFYGCALTGNVDIPDSVINIENSAFQVNGGLTSITIPNSVLSIGTYAFYGNKINNLLLSDNLQTIGNYAFYNNNLLSVTIPASVMTIGNNAFDVNPLTEVRIKGKSSPSNFTSYGTNLFGWKAGYSDANITWNAS